MHQPPGARVTLGVQRTAIFRVVMLLKAGRKIAGLSDVNFPLGVQKDIKDRWLVYERFWLLGQDSNLERFG